MTIDISMYKFLNKALTCHGSILSSILCLSVLQVTSMVSDKTQGFTWGIQMANPVGSLWRRPHLLGNGEELWYVCTERG